MPRHPRMISFSAIGLYIPGIVARITGKIFEMNGNIVDVEENCRRGMFSIFLVIDFTNSTIDIDQIFSALEEIEKAYILKALEKAGQNRSEAARLWPYCPWIDSLPCKGC